MTVKENHATITNKVKKANSKRKHLTQEQIDERIAKKAYELYENRGQISGFAEEDWLQAKKIVLAQLEPKEKIE